MDYFNEGRCWKRTLKEAERQYYKLLLKQKTITFKNDEAFIKVVNFKKRDQVLWLIDVMKCISRSSELTIKEVNSLSRRPKVIRNVVSAVIIVDQPVRGRSYHSEDLLTITNKAIARKRALNELSDNEEVSIAKLTETANWLQDHPDKIIRSRYFSDKCLIKVMATTIDNRIETESVSKFGCLLLPAHDDIELVMEQFDRGVTNIEDFFKASPIPMTFPIKGKFYMD